MDIKDKEVYNWLQSLYGTNAVPEYESNATSISLLHQLMVNAQHAERRAQILIKDYTTRTTEYRAKAQQLTTLLQGVGLSKASLSIPAQEALQYIASATCLVDAHTPSESTIMVAYNRVETQHDKVARKCDANQQLRALLVSFSQQQTVKLEHARSLEQQANAIAALEAKDLENNKKRELFHEKKLAEYQTQICSRETELQYRGYTERLGHDKIMTLWEQLQEMEKQVLDLQQQLESYSLPPDMAVARLTVQETRLQLQTIMAEVASILS